MEEVGGFQRGVFALHIPWSADFSRGEKSGPPFAPKTEDAG